MTDPHALKYTPEHEWVAVDGDPAADPGEAPAGAVVVVGITDYAARELGDIVFVDLPMVDSGVRAGVVAGEIESSKSVGELYAPLTGDIVAINQAVVDDPSLINSSPYDEGWLFKIRVDGSRGAQLLDRQSYEELTT